VERRRSYFGFDLDTEVEPLRGAIPTAVRPGAWNTLTEALLQGATGHPDQGRVRRAVETLDELWRRSGGILTTAAPAAVRERIRAQLEGVESWDDFMTTRIHVDPDALVDEGTRARLDALPGMIRVRGDAAPLDYEVAGGLGVARVRLREGQARRLRAGDLPPLDRPLRFALLRGRHPPVLADTIADLQAELRRAPRSSRSEENDRPHGPRRGKGPHRGPPGHRRRGRGGNRR
jgi:hypothetical protein